MHTNMPGTMSPAHVGSAVSIPHIEKPTFFDE